MNFINVTPKEALNRLRIIYPLWIVCGVFSLIYLPSKLITKDFTTTASNILANETLFQLGIASNLIVQLFQIIAAIYLFKLFYPVDKNSSALILIFGLLGVPIAMFSEALNYGALLLLKSNSLELANVFIQMNHFGIQLASIFWGLWLFPLGYCIYKANYFPKWLGIIVIIAGFGYLLGSFAYIFTGRLLGFFEALTMGETIFLLWLVIRGGKIKK